MPPFHSKDANGAWSVSNRHHGQCRSRCPDCTRNRGGLKIRTIPAEELLQAGDIGLIPWVPLTQRQDRFRPMRRAPARSPRGAKGADPERDRKEDDVPIPLFLAPESPARLDNSPRPIRRPQSGRLERVPLTYAGVRPQCAQRTCRFLLGSWRPMRATGTRLGHVVGADLRRLVNRHNFIRWK